MDSVGTLEAFMREYSWELFCRLLRSVDVDPEADWETILAELSEQNVDRINGKPYYGKNVMDWDFLVSDYDSKEDLQAMLYDNASSHVAEWLLNIEYDGSKDLQEICMELGAPLLAKELDKAREKNVYESSFSSDNLFVTGDVFTMERYAGAFYNPGLLDSGLELGWEIHFDYVDGERAIITFTKTE